MKLKLIPAALLLTLVGAAQAQVTVYGLVDYSYGKNAINGTAAGTGDAYDAFQFGDGSVAHGNSTTRVGLKGTTDVGGGYKTNFQLEANAVAPAGFKFGRQAWAGISGGFGEVRFGTQDSVAFQTLAGFDMNGAANDTYTGAMSGVQSAGQNGTSNAQYFSPTFGGLQVRAGLTPKGNNSTVATDPNAKSAYALGLSFANGPFAAAAAYESATTDNAALSGGSAYSAIGGSYDFGAAKVSLVYANGGTNVKGTSLGVAFPVGAATVGAQYSKNSDTQDSGTELFFNTPVFKNTTAYVDYGRKNVSASGVSTNAYSVGMILAF